MSPIKILKIANKSLSKATKSLIILDSSFNPPHSAHLAMIRAALQTEYPKPASVILMYATKNADKESKGSEDNDTRVEMMRAFSQATSELCETHICLTQHPYFVDKFNALAQEMPEAKQIYIVGYDTFVRILDKKYYPDQDLAKSGLGEFFLHGKLLCALREDDKWGNSARQREHVEKFAAGQVQDVPQHWGRNIEVLTLAAQDGLGVSSSMLRAAAESGKQETLARYITPEVRAVIDKRQLYTDTNTIKFPYLTRQHILNCSFSQWHPRFKTVSPRARVLKPLPPSFIQYLNEDGLILPQDSRLMSKIEALSSDSEASDFEDEGFAEEDPSEAFRDFHVRIEEEIRALGGAVVPKLNWSSPKDALWITADKTLKCTSANDIYLLLKSSDFVMHDLECAFEQCGDDTRPPAHGELELVLKAWFNAQPSMEFRCFVKDSRVVAISQRDANHYEFLSRETVAIVKLATDLFQSHLSAKFPDPHFVFDMYVSLVQNKAWVLDINPFSSTTDSLLFDWPEILSISVSMDPNAAEAAAAPEIRLVSKDSVMSNMPQYSAHQVPLELIDSSDGVDPATFAEEFQRRLATAVFDS